MSKMGVLRRERRKWEDLKRSSKSLKKRFATTKVLDDQEAMFCSDKRRLDRELQVAANMNPRLHDPLPFERQYFSSYHKTYDKRTAQACDVYDVNRLARKKESFSWYEPEMTVASSFRKRMSKGQNTLVSTNSRAKKAARRVKPPSYGHRPGSAGRHFDTLSMEVTRTHTALPDHKNLMTVEELFVLLHSEPTPDPDYAAPLGETAPSPALAQTFKSMISSMEDVEAPKFQVGNGKPVAGGLLSKAVDKAANNSKRRRRRRKKQDRLVQFNNTNRENPEFDNRLHLGEKKPQRALIMNKAPVNAYERVARYQRLAAGVEASPFCPERDQFRTTTLEQNLIDHPTFLEYMSRKQIRKILSRPLQDKVSEEEEEEEEEDYDEPPPPPSEPPPSQTQPRGPETKQSPTLTQVKGNKQKKAQLSVYDNMALGKTYGSDEENSDEEDSVEH